MQAEWLPFVADNTDAAPPPRAVHGELAANSS